MHSDHADGNDDRADVSPVLTWSYASLPPSTELFWLGREEERCAAGWLSSHTHTQGHTYSEVSRVLYFPCFLSV